MAEKSNDDLNIELQILKSEVLSVKADLKEIKADIKNLTGVQNNMIGMQAAFKAIWRGLVYPFLAALATGIIGFMLGRHQ